MFKHILTRTKPILQNTDKSTIIKHAFSFITTILCHSIYRTVCDSNPCNNILNSFYVKATNNTKRVWLFFFSIRILSVMRGHSVFSSSSQRPMTSDFEGFSIPDFIHYIYFPILILEKEPVFPFLMSSAKQGNYLVPFL